MTQTVIHGSGLIGQIDPDIKLIVLFGPSGISTEPVQEALRLQESRLRKLPSYTTDESQSGSIFVDTADFELLKLEKQFAWYSERGGHRYGTRIWDIERVVQAEYPTVLSVEQSNLPVLQRLVPSYALAPCFLCTFHEEELKKLFEQSADYEQYRGDVEWAKRTPGVRLVDGSGDLVDVLTRLVNCLK